jgi:hypothetical protein
LASDYPYEKDFRERVLQWLRQPWISQFEQSQLCKCFGASGAAFPLYRWEVFLDRELKFASPWYGSREEVLSPLLWQWFQESLYYWVYGCACAVKASWQPRLPVWWNAMHRVTDLLARCKEAWVRFEPDCYTVKQAGPDHPLEEAGVVKFEVTCTEEKTTELKKG